MESTFKVNKLSIFSMRCFVLSILLFLGKYSISQSPDSIRRIESRYCLQLGLGYSNTLFFEIGFAKHAEGRVGFHPFQSALYVSTEVYRDSKSYIAPKIGVWAAGGASIVGLGLNLVYYSNLKDPGRLVFRPEIGIGVSDFRFYYGYNIKTGRSRYQPFSNGLVGMNIWIRKRKVQS